MSKWIAQAGLPQQRVVGPWRELPATIALLREIADGKMPKGEAPLQYPIFIKACHITQGIQHGTKMVKSQVRCGSITLICIADGCTTHSRFT